MRKTLLLWLVLIFSLNVYGQQGPLKLDDLISQALERNPNIKSIHDSVEAQKFRIGPEGALPDPVVGFSLKNIGLDRFSVGEEMMSGVGFSISQTIPFPGKLRLKSRIASFAALQAEEALRASKLSLARQIKELYSRLYYYLKVHELLLEKKEILEKALKLAEIKYSVGKGIQADVFKAQVEVSAIEEMILTMKQMAEATKANINSLLDFSPENPLGIPEEIPFYELKKELSELSEAAMKNSPVLKEAELMIEQGMSEVDLAKKEFRPNFMVQAGKDFKGPFKDMYEVMVGIEVPLYRSKKQAKLLEESRSKLSSSRNSLASMKNELSFMLNESFLMAKTSENLIKLYKERIIPQASLALESSLSNYEVDRVDFLMLLSDINSLFSYEMDYIKNLTNLWISVSRIEEMTSLEFIK